MVPAALRRTRFSVVRHLLNRLEQVVAEPVVPPKREACLMAMSYSYDIQAKVFDRMIAEKSPTAYLFVINENAR